MAEDINENQRKQTKPATKKRQSLHNMFSPLEEGDLQTKEIYSENIYSSNNPRIIGSSPQLRNNSKSIQIEVEGFENIENDDNEEWKKVVYKKKRLFQSCKNDDEEEEGRVFKENDKVVERGHREKGKEATEKVKRKNGHQRTIFNPNRTLESRRVGRGRKIDRIEDKCVICSDPSILAIQVMSKIVFCLCNNLHNPDCSDNMSKNMSEEERRRQERQFAELIKGIETWPEEINDVNDPSQFPTPAEAAAAAKKTPRQRTISNASTTSAPGSAPATPLPQRSNVWRLRHNCSDCEEKFGLKSELTEHMKSKHGKTPYNMIFDMAREIIDGIIENCCELKIEGVKNSTPEEEVINNSGQNLTITNNNIKTKANNNLRFYVSNVRGFFSKKVILEKI